MDKAAVVNEKPLVVYLCSICGKNFKYRSTLSAHIKKKHKLRVVPLNKGSIKCPLCKDAFRDGNELDKHISLVHNISVEHTKLTFKTEEEFKVWKSNIERETNSYYKCRNLTKCKKCKLIYYQCHRSGVYTPRLNNESVRQHSMKAMGSIKIDSVCPARIRASINKKGCVEVDYVSQHVGHECEPGRINLTTAERKSLAEELMAGIPNQRIINTFNANSQRKHITNHDLHNIRRDFNINTNVRLHEEDAKSVAALIEKYQTEVENPILWYKPYGQEDSVVGKDNFVLIFMNCAQKNFLCKYGNNILMIDSIQYTNPNKIHLTTLMVVDDHNQGFPVAFLWSITQSEVVFHKFFQCLKEKVPHLRPKTFMSDHTNAFFVAFVRVYNHTPRKLICDRHVKKSFTENLNKIVNIEKRKYVEKAVLKLMNELDQQAFTVMHTKVLHELLNDEETLKYGRYFSIHFSKIPEQWAHCFRKDLPRYACLKNWYQELKRNTHNECQERLDHSINNVLECLRMRFMGRLVCLDRNNVPSEFYELKKRHKLAEEFRANAQIFEQEADSKWLVSSTNQSTQHKVSLNVVNCQCNFQCSECNRCLHEFCCTCPDYVIRYNMCKHIHLVGMTLTKKDEDPIADVEDPIADVEDPIADEEDIIADVEDPGDIVEEEIETVSHCFIKISTEALEKKRAEVMKQINKLSEITSSYNNNLEALSCMSEMLSTVISRVQALERHSFMIPSKSINPQKRPTGFVRKKSKDNKSV